MLEDKSLNITTIPDSSPETENQTRIILFGNIKLDVDWSKREIIVDLNGRTMTVSGKTKRVVVSEASSDET